MSGVVPHGRHSCSEEQHSFIFVPTHPESYKQLSANPASCFWPLKGGAKQELDPGLVELCAQHQ